MGAFHQNGPTSRAATRVRHHGSRVSTEYVPVRARRRHRVLALHGLTGHGRRWEALATRPPAGRPLDRRPDLRGHGRSTWAPPWGLEAHVHEPRRHSRRACASPSWWWPTRSGRHRTAPRRAPSPTASGARAARSRDRARSARLMHRWRISPSRPPTTPTSRRPGRRRCTARGVKSRRDVLESEIAEHLVPLAERPGRLAAIHLPAVVRRAGVSWRARPSCRPRTCRPSWCRRSKVQPPYVTPEFRTALADHLGDRLTAVDLTAITWCRRPGPDEVAELIRTLLWSGGATTEEQVERVRALVASIPPRPGGDLRRHRGRGRAVECRGRSAGSCAPTPPTCRGTGCWARRAGRRRTSRGDSWSCWSRRGCRWWTGGWCCRRLGFGRNEVSVRAGRKLPPVGAAVFAYGPNLSVGAGSVLRLSNRMTEKRWAT